MGFAVGIEEEKKEEKAVKGQYQKVAVGCWFTSNGKAIPKMLKYEDEAGEIHSICEIRVISSEQKHFAGIYSMKYKCCTVVDGRSQEFVLLYYPEINQWDMVL